MKEKISMINALFNKKNNCIEFFENGNIVFFNRFELLYIKNKDFKDENLIVKYDKKYKAVNAILIK